MNNEPKDSNWKNVYLTSKAITVTRKYIVRPYLLNLDSNFFERKDVLDLGSGQSDIALMLLEKHNVKSYTGIDISAEAINNAKEILKDSKGEIKLLVGTAEKTIFNDESFDTILSINLVPLMDNKEKLSNILKESLRLLKKGGNLLLVATNEKAVLSDLKNENFKVKLIDKNIVPIKYELDLKREDGSYIQVVDYCWPTNVLIEELKEVGFNVKDVVDLNDKKVMSPDNQPPFLFIQAEK